MGASHRISSTHLVVGGVLRSRRRNTYLQHADNFKSSWPNSSKTFCQPHLPRTRLLSLLAMLLAGLFIISPLSTRRSFAKEETDVTGAANSEEISGAESGETPGEEDQDLFHVDIEDLWNIPVRIAAKKEQKVAQAPAAVYVITQEDIRRGGFRSVPEALRMVPGVNGWAGRGSTLDT